MGGGISTGPDWTGAEEGLGGAAFEPSEGFGRSGCLLTFHGGNGAAAEEEAEGSEAALELGGAGADEEARGPDDLAKLPNTGGGDVEEKAPDLAHAPFVDADPGAAPGGAGGLPGPAGGVGCLPCAALNGGLLSRAESGPTSALGSPHALGRIPGAELGPALNPGVLSFVPGAPAGSPSAKRFM